MSDNKSASNMMMVTFMAGLAGAVVALLLAPRSGKETREVLKKNASDLKNITKNNLLKSKEALEEKVDEAKNLKQRIAQAVSDTGSKAKQEINEVRQPPNSSKREGGD